MEYPYTILLNALSPSPRFNPSDPTSMVRLMFGAIPISVTREIEALPQWR